MCVDGLNHLAWPGLVCLGFGFGFGYGCGFGFGFDTRLGSGPIAPKSCLWGSVFFGSLCGPCVCVCVCRVSSDFAVLYRVIVVSLLFAIEFKF